MKRSLVIYDASLQAAGYVPGRDYEFVCNIHDEFGVTARPDIAEHVGQLAVSAMTAAGESFNFRCPIAGEYKIGNNWAETH
jgi:DNA polymerase-1